MPRKGSHKTRTGCVTCKIRRVKCDEGRPSCNRCTSTGRRCDGYSSRAISLKPLPVTLAPLPRSLQSWTIHPEALRALQFFCEIVVPSVSKPYNPYLWKSLVVQSSTAEPAVLHSALAISSLYEDFYSKQRDIPQMRENKHALRHYNLAIGNILKANNQSLVLLVCFLFICIEAFQGNMKEVFRHLRHGLEILQNIQAPHPWVNDHLGPAFRRLSIVPLYFGIDGFQPPGLHEPILPLFSSLDKAAYCMEGLLVRSIQFARLGCHFPYERPSLNIDATELLVQQADLKLSLEQWLASFSKFESQHPCNLENEATHWSLFIQADVLQIWVSAALIPGEGIFDQYLDIFRRIINYAERMGHALYRGSDLTPKRSFRFEMGYLPYLVYVVSKCRDLTTRLKAVSLMKRFGPDRESLWDRDTLFEAAVRLIEGEHGIEIDHTSCEPIGSVDWARIPGVEERFEDLTSFLPKQV